jgi:biotin carboxyl carrier protein
MTYTFKIKDKVYTINIEKEKDQTVVQIGEKDIPVEFQKIDDNLYSIIIEGKSLTIGVLRNGNKLQIFMDGDLFEIEAISERDQRKSPQELSGVQELKSPMPSRIVKILKEVGDAVEVEEGIIVLEAMKMESELKSPIKGKVTDILVNEGDAVEAGISLLIVSSE